MKGHYKSWNCMRPCSYCKILFMNAAATSIPGSVEYRKEVDAASKIQAFYTAYRKKVMKQRLTAKEKETAERAEKWGKEESLHVHPNAFSRKPEKRIFGVDDKGGARGYFGPGGGSLDVMHQMEKGMQERGAKFSVKRVEVAATGEGRQTCTLTHSK